MSRLAQLDPRTARRLAGTVGGISLLLLASTLVLLFLERNGPVPSTATMWGVPAVADVLTNMAVAVLGILIAVKKPANPIGWLFLVAGFFLGVTGFCEAYALRALFTEPGSWPAGRALAFLGNTFWPVPISMLILLLLLFPTGAVPSRRWRVLAATDLIVSAVFVVSTGILSATNWNHPYLQFNSTPAGYPTVARLAVGVITIGFFALPLMLVAALVAVVIRFRRSRGDERLQMKWFTFAAAIVVVVFALNQGNSAFFSLLNSLAFFCLWAAIAIAMLKYRLYDIDVVIRKTVVGGLLVAFVTVVYAVVVAGVGVLGSTTSALHSGPLIAAATAIVAIAFQPVLRRARHVANRLVYGDRATPYEVLSEFSERMGEAYATDDLPQRMTRILAEGTGATTASVWLHVGNELRPASTWPADAPTPPPAIAPADGDVTIPGAGQTFAVRHQGELLGALSVVMPPEEPLATEQENLCTGLASQAGLVLRNVRLIEELRASRQRLVTAQDQERRKLERNLHDGAQQQLVALAVKGRLVSTLLERDLARARALLDEIQTETTDALETLRDLARGIYPPLLADQGLPAALEAQVRKAPLPVEVSADGLGRYAPEVEAAVYFCCLEAVQNVSKYANASSASVELRVDTTDLTFVVHDDGVGFDIAQTVMGTGIQGIADRLAALGGRLDIDSAPGAGTSLRGRIPVG